MANHKLISVNREITVVHHLSDHRVVLNGIPSLQEAFLEAQMIGGMGTREISREPIQGGTKINFGFEGATFQIVETEIIVLAIKR